MAWLAAGQPAGSAALVLTGAGWLAASPLSQAHAQSRSRPSSSGGYSRPSGGGGSYSRTPSFSASPPSSARRTPSFSSGGYGLPSREPRAPSVASPFSPSQSAGDRAFSRERSREALGSFGAQRDAIPSRPPRQFDPPSQQRQPGSSSSGSWFDYEPSIPAPTRRYARPVEPAPPDRRAEWYANRGWSGPPLPAYGAGRTFGVWDGLFLWSLLSNLGRPGSAEFFHNHRDDEGYREWRSEADRLAQENAEIRRKLEELDGQLAERDGQPKDPDYLPPDVPADVATAPPPSAPDNVRTPSVAAATGSTSGGGRFVWPVLLGGAGVLGFLAWQRRRPTSAGTTGGVAGGRTTMPSTTNMLQSAGAMLRHKLSGEGYAPQLFRVGMTLQLDPTPFVLAGDAIKLPQPEGVGQVSVKAVGRADAPGGGSGSGGGSLVRLYLPDDRSMIQLVVSAAGEPVESRLFGTIDEVNPADAAEWGVWLDETEGLIGWPEFQTKDGKLYARAWSPGGASRVEPRTIAETVEGLDGTRTVQSRAMLYAAATGVPAPAAPTEYILVSAVDDGRQAWVEIRSGIDLNPATLQLA